MTARAIAVVAAMRKHLFDGGPWPAPRPDEAVAVELALNRTEVESDPVGPCEGGRSETDWPVGLNEARISASRLTPTLASTVSFARPQPRSSIAVAALTRAAGGAFASDIVDFRGELTRDFH